MLNLPLPKNYDFVLFGSHAAGMHAALPGFFTLCGVCVRCIIPKQMDIVQEGQKGSFGCYCLLHKKLLAMKKVKELGYTKKSYLQITNLLLDSDAKKFYSLIDTSVAINIIRDPISVLRTMVTLPKSVEFSLIERLGMLLLNAKAQGIAIISFIGQVLIMILDSLMRPWRIRLKELSNHIISAGISAIFIVGLTAFLIGIVLAYQGAVMLERFGASVLVVDIMGISTLREIAPLIASIVVAGRSASSFTAQIGVMKITEELYAMETMGFAPFRFVVMPKQF